MDDLTAHRLALNEARFREINERLAVDVRELIDAGEQIAFVCECANTGCRQTIELSLDQYAAVRADDLCFAVVPGHEIPAIESIVRREDGFYVIRKRRGQDAARRAR